MLLNMVIKLKSICFEVEAIVISRWSFYCFSFAFKQREHNLSLIYDKIQMIKLSHHILDTIKVCKLCLYSLCTPGVVNQSGKT